MRMCVPCVVSLSPSTNQRCCFVRWASSRLFFLGKYLVCFFVCDIEEQASAAPSARLRRTVAGFSQRVAVELRGGVDKGRQKGRRGVVVDVVQAKIDTAGAVVLPGANASTDSDRRRRGTREKPNGGRSISAYLPAAYHVRVACIVCIVCIVRALPPPSRSTIPFPSKRAVVLWVAPASHACAQRAGSGACRRAPPPPSLSQRLPVALNPS